MLHIIQDTLWMLGSLYYLVIFRFGFGEPLEIAGITARVKWAWFYILVGMSYLIFIAFGLDLLERIY